MGRNGITLNQGASNKNPIKMNGENIWQVTLGSDALLRVENLLALVFAVPFALAWGFLTLEWMPHNFMIAQVCIGIGGLAIIAWAVYRAYKSTDYPRRRVIFSLVIILITSICVIPFIRSIEIHKTEAKKELPNVHIQAGPNITQTATSSSCSNIVGNDDKIKCEEEKRKEGNDPASSH
jgi:uncharacterized membrane protein YciS (DUF1049 family)